MQTMLRTLLIAAVGLAPAVLAAPDAVAADLSGKSVKRVVIVRHHHHHRSRVVRDYDGTPIVLRRATPVTMGDDDGVVRTRWLENAYPALRAQPSRYLNGQPVRPTTRLRVLRSAAAW